MKPTEYSGDVESVAFLEKTSFKGFVRAGEDCTRDVTQTVSLRSAGTGHRGPSRIRAVYMLNIENASVPSAGSVLDEVFDLSWTLMSAHRAFTISETSRPAFALPFLPERDKAQRSGLCFPSRWVSPEVAPSSEDSEIAQTLGAAWSFRFEAGRRTTAQS